MARAFLCVALLIISFPVSFAIDYQSVVNQFVQDPIFRYGTVSVGFYELSSGKKLAGKNTQQALIPASVLKLLTTAASLEQLGGKYRFKTSLYYDGNITSDGVLHGNLYVEGSGDPTLGSRYASLLPDSFLTEWSMAVKQKGIRQIEGTVLTIEKESGASTDYNPKKWLFEDVANYYGAEVGNLNVYDNSYQLTITSSDGGRFRRFKTYPDIPDLECLDRLAYWDKNVDSIIVYPVIGRAAVSVEGRLSAHTTEHTAKGSIPSPATLLVRDLTHRLQDFNINTGHSPINSFRDKNELQRLTVWESDPLSEICKITNVRSMNLYAEAILRAMALTIDSDKQSGAQSLLRFWNKRGINTEGAWLYDGSGLSPVNRISSQLLADVLIYMGQKGKEKNAFMESLPIAGQSGTVARLLPQGISNDVQWKLKSGSMEQVSCYAGYLIKKGKQYVFVLMVNQYNGKRSDVNRKVSNLLQQLSD